MYIKAERGTVEDKRQREEEEKRKRENVYIRGGGQVGELNVYRNNEQTMFARVYVDDLLFLEQQQEVDKTFKEVQKHVLLRPTGTLGIGQTI